MRLALLDTLAQDRAMTASEALVSFLPNRAFSGCAVFHLSPAIENSEESAV
jgi:hypothetical protein